MSASTGAVPATDQPAAGPNGLVTLIVGEVGRTGSKSRARSAGNRTENAKDGSSVRQWSCRWSSNGPGAISPGSDDEPDLTLTIGTDDAYRVKRGELDPSVAFMQGKLKSTGDNALLLSILGWSATPAFTKALAEWAAGQPA